MRTQSKFRSKASRKDILNQINKNRRSTVFTPTMKLMMNYKNKTSSSKLSQVIKKVSDFSHEEEEDEEDEVIATLMNTTEIDEEIINQGCLQVVNQFGTQRSPYIIDPDSTYKGFWDLFNFLLIVYQSL